MTGINHKRYTGPLFPPNPKTACNIFFSPHLSLPQCYSFHSLVMALLSVFILFSTISLLLADTQENEASGWVTILDSLKSPFLLKITYIKGRKYLIRTKSFSAKGIKPRNGRLFYVYTSKTTSTYFTNTYCYVSSATIGICGKKKKRRSIVDSPSVDREIPKFLDGYTGYKSVQYKPKENITTHTWFLVRNKKNILHFVNV